MIWGLIEDRQWISECNAGKYEYCKKILSDVGFDGDPIINPEVITSEQGKNQLAKAKIEVDAEKAAEMAAAAKKDAAEAKKDAAEAKKLAEAVERRRTIARYNGFDVTLANFNRIQPGMSYQQVVDILGKQGTVSAESHLAGYHTIIYSWNGPKNDGANMNATFQNGRLINKAQAFLK